MVTPYCIGGEDIDFFTFTGSVTTSGGKFRSTYARCALDCGSNGYWQNWTPFSTPTFWFSGYSVSNSTSNNAGPLLSWYDTNMILRLAVYATGTAQTYRVYKVDNTSTFTQLGSDFVMPNYGANLLKLDVFVNNAVSGQVSVYLSTASGGSVQVFTFSGDTTTNGVTTLCNVRLGSPNVGGLFPTDSWKWSEIMMLDTDTRSLSLQTFPPVANGNTHTFDTGLPAASNVNEITLNLATLDGSSVAGQIDQYTIPAIATGTFGILLFGISSMAECGTTGPQKMDLGVRIAPTDYWSADIPLISSWKPYQNWWANDPSTSSPWAALPVNIGIKSVT